MHFQHQRRRLLLSSLAGGLSLAGWPAAAAAEAETTAGKVYFGFAGGSSPIANPLLPLLKAMRGRYQPDLGLALTLLPGNSGARAIETVQHGPADGSSVLLTPSGTLTLFPQLRGDSTADPLSHFVPVAVLCEVTFVFVVGPTVPAEVTTLKGYLDWVRQNPTQAQYGVPGIGIPPHFAGMAMARAVDLPLKAVAYQGGVPMMKDVVGGSMPAAFAMIGALSSGGRDQGFRPLAINSEQRWPGLPDLPTLQELNAGDAIPVESLGFYVPAATPMAKVLELNDAIRHAQQDETVVASMRDSLLKVAPKSPDQFAAALAQERDAWRALVKRERFTLRG